MNTEAINLKEKLAKISEHWSPRVIAEMNDYQLKLVIEPRGVINTGNAGGDKTARNDLWI